MKPQRVNLTIDIGRTFRYWHGFREDDDTENPDGTTGTYKDLTGYTFRAQIRETASRNSALIADFTIDDSDMLTTADIYMSIDETDTDDITHSRGYWDLLAITPDGDHQTWKYGEVTFTGRPTQ